MNHLDHLSSLIDLQDIQVVDIGAGNGKFARAFARRGAQVIGIEIDEEKVAIAKLAEHPDVEIRLGRGEALPLEDESVDLACFMFSFHHIPSALQEAALKEVHRVLTSKGRLHLVEPRPYGPMNEVMIDLDNETDVLIHSHERLDRLAEGEDFDRLSENDYAITLKTPDFQSFLDGIIAVDPRRADKLPDVREKMEAVFQRVAERTEAGFILAQPCIAHHFVKTV